MPFRIWVGNAATAYNVTLYSRAGATPNLDYDLQYSQDNSTWTYIAGPLNSTTCTQLSTVSISSGIIYVRAVRDTDNFLIYGRGSGSSTCPANAAFACTYSVSVTSNRDVAYTVYVDGSGNFSLCPV